jgi:hypothetical protein
VTRSGVERERLAQLLRNPRRVGVIGHMEVNDPSSAVLDREPDIEDPMFPRKRADRDEDGSRSQYEMRYGGISYPINVEANADHVGDRDSKIADQQRRSNAISSTREARRERVLRGERVAVGRASGACDDTSTVLLRSREGPERATPRR